MRLWSIHPKYLDTVGLVALWREALLARKVLENRTKGYKNHPQLCRFKQQDSPIETMNSYLKEIYKESNKRNFNFDCNKLIEVSNKYTIPVTDGQIEFEFNHLLKKFKQRNTEKYKLIKDLKKIEINPVFNIINGEVEIWEKINL